MKTKVRRCGWGPPTSKHEGNLYSYRVRSRVGRQLAPVPQCVFATLNFYFSCSPFINHISIIIIVTFAFIVFPQFLIKFFHYYIHNNYCNVMEVFIKRFSL